MTITKALNETTLTIALDGRLDTTTAPQLDTELRNSLEGITELILDFENLSYISSAGLRILLSTQKTMNKQGSMIIRNVCDDIKEIFDLTGFQEYLTIE